MPEGADKPVTPKVVIAAAKEAGFSRAAVFRAREALREEVVNTRGRRSPVNCWWLASDDEGESEGADHEPAPPCGRP